MNLVWTIRSAPEPAHLSPAQRQALVRANVGIGTRIMMILRPIALGLGAGSLSGIPLIAVNQQLAFVVFWGVFLLIAIWWYLRQIA